MNLLGLIQSKKAGNPLTPEQISELVQAVVAGSVPDYQLATLLTVICYEKLDAAETLAMTSAFVASGETLSWEGLSRPVVDKHSTGGVGDKITLALAPLMAAAGLAMPKMSGRGLGHTGGTIDKLESIPGLRTDLSLAEFHGILESVGCAVAGQTAHLVPADKIFYAMRDATDNVREQGLVTASIMSKKLAAGAPCIVLDVKCGNGAFFRDEREARRFAELAMRIGSGMGRRVACVITDMDQPLGHAVGNTLEVLEVLDLLSGSRPLVELRAVLLSLGSVLLLLSNRHTEMTAATRELEELLDSGAVLEKFRQWISAQGGRLAELPADVSQLRGVQSLPVHAKAAGQIYAIDCLALGDIARRCGAGRLMKQDKIVPDAGLLCHVRIGDEVEVGQELARLFIADEHQVLANELLQRSLEVFSIAKNGSVKARSPVIDVVLA